MGPIATIVQVAPGRLIGLAEDGDMRLIWDNAAIRLPMFDLSHLATLLEAWAMEEELPFLRRGYYRLVHSADGQIQLWLNGTGLALSRDDLRSLTAMVTAASDELGQPLCRQPHSPLGLGYRPLTVTPRAGKYVN